MIRCKGFYACSNTVGLCQEVDRWLVENQITPVKMETVATGRLDHHVSIIVWYEEKTENNE